MRSLARAFASRNYRLFFGGQVVSLIGTWMQSVAQAWLVYRLTGSVAVLARWTMPGSVGFGAALIAFSWSRNILLSCVLLCLAGFTMMMQTASTNTLLQAMSPNALRGRTMAVYAMMFMGLAPVGSLIAGLVAERIGVPATLTAGGAICVAAGLAFRLRPPKLVPKTHELVRLAAAS